MPCARVRTVEHHHQCSGRVTGSDGQAADQSMPLRATMAALWLRAASREISSSGWRLYMFSVLYLGRLGRVRTEATVHAVHIHSEYCMQPLQCGGRGKVSALPLGMHHYAVAVVFLTTCRLAAGIIRLSQPVRRMAGSRIESHVADLLVNEIRKKHCVRCSPQQM